MKPRSSLLRLLLLAGATGAAPTAPPAHAQQASPASTPLSSAPSAPGPDAAIPKAPGPKSPAAAPDPNAGRLEEVVVTAQRRSEKLQNVPISVTALTSATLQKTGIVNTASLFESVPALTVTNSSGFLEPRIRGVGNSSAGPSVEDSVSTYIDGVYIASAPGSLLSLNNVQRVEILKGPQGTLFGRNATGGLVQVVTKDPSDEFGGNADFSYGNYNALRSNLYVTGPVAGGVTADLAVTGAHQGDGYGKNLFNGSDIYKTDRDIAARSKWLAHLGDDTTLRLALDYEDILSSDPAYSAVSGTLGTLYPYRIYYPPRYADVNDNPIHQILAGGASLRADHDFGPVTLTSISSYRRTTFDQAFDADLSPAPIVREDYVQNDEQATEELQVAPSEKGILQWVAGFYYFHLGSNYDPLQIASGLPGKQATSDSFAFFTTDSVAGYAQATYEVLPGLDITGGFRFTDEQRHIQGDLAKTSAAGRLTVTPYAPAEVSSDTPTARFAIDYKFTPDVMGYFSYNRGFKSGGFNPQSPTAPAYSPEYLDAYELGVKSEELDGRLRLNLSGYLYEYQDIQVNTFIGSLGVVYNGAAARLYGLDGDFDFKVTPDLSVTGGVSLIHDRFTEFPNAVVATVLPNGRTTTTRGAATGNRLPFTPDAAFNIGVDYRHDVPGGSADFVVQEEFSTGFFVQSDNFLDQPSYNILNASVTYRPAGTNYYLTLFGNNLLDDTIVAFGNVSSTGENLSFQAPRLFGGRIGVRF